MFGNATPNHVNSWQRAVDEVRAHYAAIRHLAIEMEEKDVKEIAELAKAKSDAVMDHIKALHADLDQIANCCDAKEAMIASTALEACANHLWLCWMTWRLTWLASKSPWTALSQ